jgi:ATP-binding cassette subfamily E protein 1
VEHDLSVLDYLSDFVCCLYGKPSIYGVVTMPYSVREGAQNSRFTSPLLTSGAGINIFLDGFIPTENLRFREESLTFKMVETAEEILVDKTRHYSYPSMTKTLGGFKLTVEEGTFTDSEIIVMLGRTGPERRRFVRLLAGEEPDDPSRQAKHGCVTQAADDLAQVPRHRPHALIETDQVCLHARTIPKRRREADEH